MIVIRSNPREILFNLPIIYQNKKGWGDLNHEN
jgi:hypothetical protein